MSASIWDSWQTAAFGPIAELKKLKNHATSRTPFSVYELAVIHRTTEIYMMNSQ